MAIKLPPVLSQSSLQDYVDCPRRFELRYLQQLQYPAIEAEPALENEKRRQEGAYFHRLAQQYWLGLPAPELTPHANSGDLRAWWMSFLATDFLLGDHSRHAEVSLSARLGQFRLVAKYDLVAVLRGKQVLIFDWKTARILPKKEWLARRQQTRVYRALMAAAGAGLDPSYTLEPEQIELVYWFPGFPHDSVRLPYDSQQAARDWEDLTTLSIEIAEAKSFAKTDDLRACRFCLYRSHCDRGTRAGDISEFDADSAAEDPIEFDYDQVGEIAF
jgi:hypothetical protein